MDSRRLINVQTRIFLLIVFFTWSLTAIFFALQYTREREHKVEMLNSDLQLLNSLILDRIEHGGSINRAFIDSLNYGDSLRVSVIDFKGHVKFDSNGEVKINHAGRAEFQQAMKSGRGFTKRRLSAVNDKEYFYSATKGDGVVVRTALPYTHSLASMLTADSFNSYVIVAIAMILSILAWFAAHNMSRSVKNLRRFAHEAEFGDISHYDMHSFPDDELGDISSHIVNLYKVLQETALERDRMLRESIKEQRERNLLKQRLSNNISHEIKTPVHIIQACLETLENSGDSLTASMKKGLLDKAYDNARRLSALLSDLSVITRISDAPQHIAGGEQVDVTAVVQAVASDMAVYPQEQQMRIDLQVPQGVMIVGNKSLVESIFRNLMVNAFHYSEGRDVEVKLTSENSQYYYFTFADNGEGVAPEHLEHLFERFYRVDAGRSRQLGGTGLGLSIVKNAVQFHHGNITVANRDGGGLIFSFSLHK